VTKLLDKIADASGILCFLLVSIGYIALVSPFLPETLDSPEAVHAHLTAHPPTTALWVAAWLEAAGLAFLVVLATRIAGRLQAAGSGYWLPTAAVAFAVAGFAIKLGSFAPVLAALDVERYGPETVTALLSINDAAHTVSSALDAGSLVLLGLGALATSALPRWLTALTLVAGVADLLGVAVSDVAGLLRTVFLIWLLAVSGWLLARGNRTASSREPAIAA